MASPTVQNGAPNTPPPSDSTTKNEGKAAALPDVPATSLDDDGSAKRPRDARLLHIVLHNLGVQSYQERVPLQLLDFAYRYTSSILSDALRLSSEGYSGQLAEKKRGNANATTSDESSGITVVGLRQAIASRQGDVFQTALPKEYMLEQAAERNRVALPKVERGYGLQLPEEKYCLTGTGWSLKEEWYDDDEDDEISDAAQAPTNGVSTDDRKADLKMGGTEDGDAADDDEDEEGAGKMEDVFGEEPAAADDDDDAMVDS